MQDWYEIRHDGINDEVGRLKMQLQFFELAGKAYQSVNRAADQIRHMNNVDDEDYAFGQRFYDSTADELEGFRWAYKKARADLSKLLFHEGD